MNKKGPIVVSDLIKPENVTLKLAGLASTDVFEELIRCIPEIAGNPDAHRTLLHALLERERLHSTGIGDGIALPHARNALVGLMDHAVLVFGRHEKGLDFGAVDGEPARLFFLIVAPTVTEHLGVLARISRLMRDSRVRQKLLAADRADTVITALREAEKALTP